MEPNTLIFFISAAIIGIGTYYLFFNKRAVVKGKIASTPEKKMSEVKDGEVVSIKGNVVLIGKTLTAPLTKRKCAYYCIKVRRTHRDSTFFSNYKRFDEEKGADLVLFDGENYALIDTKLVVSHLYQDNIPMSGSQEIRKYLEKHGKPKDVLSDFLMDVNVTEGVLEEGEKVAVAGKAIWCKPQKFKLNIKADKILYIQGLNEYGVYVTEDLF